MKGAVSTAVTLETPGAAEAPLGSLHPPHCPAPVHPASTATAHRELQTELPAGQDPGRSSSYLTRTQALCKP